MKRSILYDCFLIIFTFFFCFTVVLRNKRDEDGAAHHRSTSSVFRRSHFFRKSSAAPAASPLTKNHQVIAPFVAQLRNKRSFIFSFFECRASTRWPSSAKQTAPCPKASPVSYPFLNLSRVARNLNFKICFLQFKTGAKRAVERLKRKKSGSVIFFFRFSPFVCAFFLK